MSVLLVPNMTIMRRGCSRAAALAMVTGSAYSRNQIHAFRRDALHPHADHARHAVHLDLAESRQAHGIRIAHKEALLQVFLARILRLPQKSDGKLGDLPLVLALLISLLRLNGRLLGRGGRTAKSVAARAAPTAASPSTGTAHSSTARRFCAGASLPKLRSMAQKPLSQRRRRAREPGPFSLGSNL